MFQRMSKSFPVHQAGWSVQVSAGDTHRLDGSQEQTDSKNSSVTKEEEGPMLAVEAPNKLKLDL